MRLVRKRMVITYVICDKTMSIFQWYKKFKTFLVLFLKNNLAECNNSASV